MKRMFKWLGDNTIGLYVPNYSKIYWNDKNRTDLKHELPSSKSYINNNLSNGNMIELKYTYLLEMLIIGDVNELEKN